MHSLSEQVRFDAQGLVAAIVQDVHSGAVLMLGYLNAQTLQQTLETGVMTYWSRSRNQVWVKGETSGHTQHVRAVYLDCDGDALLFEVEQVGGAACHTGHRSCFYRRLDGERLVEIESALVSPDQLYGVSDPAGTEPAK